MQRPWRHYDPLDLQPVKLVGVAAGLRDFFNSFSIEFVSIGFEHSGDFRAVQAGQERIVRYFHSVDGALFSSLSQGMDGQAQFETASILSDGTCLRSVPRGPRPPWNCCRFPVYTNFVGHCSLEELLVRHLIVLGELEQGCGKVIQYTVSDLPEVVCYVDQLMHETIHAVGAPRSPLSVPSASSVRLMATH